MSSIERIDSLLEPSLVYLTAATVDSILDACESSGIYSNKKACEEFIALCLIAGVTNKKATSRDIADTRFTTVRPFISSSFMLNNSVNNSVLSTAGLCFLTISKVQAGKFGRAFKAKFGKEHPWDSSDWSTSVSEEQRKILRQKTSKISLEDAKRLRNTFLSKSGISSGTSSVGA